MSHTSEPGVRRRVTGAGAALGGALVFGLAPIAAAPPAHADLFDLDWISDILGTAGDSAGGVDALGGLDSLGDLPGSLSAVQTDFSSLLDQLITQPLQTGFDDWVTSSFGTQVDDLINSLAGQDVIGPQGSLVGSWLFGGDEGPSAAAETAPSLAAGSSDSAGATDTTDTPTNVTVPIHMTNTTEPVVDISVGSGQNIPVVVDTGSNGLVVPWQDISFPDLLQFPENAGFGSYAGGMGYFYVQLPETVSFTDADGGAVTTSTVPVDVVLFSYPTQLSTLFTGWSLPSFLSSADADGVLGIAPDAAGPNSAGTETVIQGLPGDLGKGVLFDEPNNQLVFGPAPSDLGQGTAVDGVANTTLWVSIDGQDPPVQVPAIIDSGGVYGTVPTTDPGTPLPDGTVINVYANQGDSEPLYSITTGPDNPAPTTISPGTTANPGYMNTGYYPFKDGPVYISYGADGAQTIFYP